MYVVIVKPKSLVLNPSKSIKSNVQRERAGRKIGLVLKYH